MKSCAAQRRTSPPHHSQGDLLAGLRRGDRRFPDGFNLRGIGWVDSGALCTEQEPGVAPGSEGRVHHQRAPRRV